MTPVDRNAVQASFWQFDPDTEEEGLQVEAMPASLSVTRSVDYVLVSVRGRRGRRHEVGDSVWLEITDAEALRLIARLAAAVSP